MKTKLSLYHYSRSDFNQFNEEHFRVGAYGIGHYFYINKEDGNLPLKYLYGCEGYISHNLNEVSPRKWNRFVKKIQKELSRDLRPFMIQKKTDFVAKDFYHMICRVYEGNSNQLNWSKFLDILRSTTKCNCLVVDDIAVMFNYKDIKITKQEVL